MQERPFSVSVAGFDPSQGAGVGADLKTFEQFGVQGLGVCTAITYQTESEFQGLNWVEPENIFKQFEVLAAKYSFEHVKVGLIESFDVMEWLVARMLELRPELKIVWDPILSATAGFEFHNLDSKPQQIKLKRRFSKWVKRLELTTPNLEEAKQLSGEDDLEKASEFMSSYCNTWVKSALETEDAVTDHLYINQVQFELTQSKLTGSKHGTGCILSAAVTAGLANGKSLYEACVDAHGYLNSYLKSSATRLGHHKELTIG